LKALLNISDEFANGSGEWLLIDHRLSSIKEQIGFLLAKTNREHRVLKVDAFDSDVRFEYLLHSSMKSNLVETEDLQQTLHELSTQLNRLETSTQSLEPVDESENSISVNRTKLHRFIRLHDELDILHQRLQAMNDRSQYLLTGDHVRFTGDLKLIFDRLNSVRRIVRIYLERLETYVERYETRESWLSRQAASPVHLQVSIHDETSLKQSYRFFQRIYQ
jgi:hypothetical protein